MLFANNCNTTLASSLTSGATSMSVTSATGFPSPTGVQYFYCTLADAATQTTIEIVKVTAVSGTTFTIVRGQDGTTGTAFASGAVVSLRLVSASLNDFPKLDENNTFTYAPTFNTALGVASGGTGVMTATGAGAGASVVLSQNPAINSPVITAYSTSTIPLKVCGLSGQFTELFDVYTYSGGTLAFQINSSGAIATGTWNGSVIGAAYGGTGEAGTLTGILYGNGTSAHTVATTAQLLSGIGTLPVANGGTGQTSFTASQIHYGSFSTSAGLTFDGTNFATTGSATAARFIPTSSTAPTNGLYLPTTNTLGFAVNSVQAMTLFASGGLSLGNTTDPGKGCLSLTAASDCTLTMGSSAGAYSSNLTMNSSSGGGSAIRAPYALIGITGGSGGVILNSGATAWSSFSDKRLKNITGIYDNALSDISKLQPVKFTWKADESNKPCVGVIAQSVETVIPEAIDSRASIDGDSTKYLSVRYTDIIPLMIASIQELNSNLTTLQASYDAYVASHP